jgi:hypothetical protein
VWQAARVVERIELSAVLVAGPCRARAQRVLDALGAQTARDRMELVVVDLAPHAAPLRTPDGTPAEYLERPGLDHWGGAKAEGLRAARGAVVAFLEDHCYPAPGWADAVLDAHRGPWAGVGYAFTNANPGSYVSRTSLLARYGAFAHPARGGEAVTVSGNNVSYKRDVLMGLGDDLEDLLAIDFNVQERLRRRGHRLSVEPRALAAHENFERVSLEGRTGRPYCRLLAAERARSGGWSRLRRLAYGIGAPLGAPAMRLARLTLSLRGRRELWRDFVLGLPVIAVMYLWDASGEAAGYLLGPGHAPRETLRWELEELRVGRDG